MAFIITELKLRMEMGNVPKRQKPDHRKNWPLNKLKKLKLK